MDKPNPGDLVDGHYYQGGDPSDPKNWLAPGTIQDGHQFKSGLAKDPDNWHPVEGDFGPGVYGSIKSGLASGVRKLGKAIDYIGGVGRTVEAAPGQLYQGSSIPTVAQSIWNAANPMNPEPISPEQLNNVYGTTGGQVGAGTLGFAFGGPLAAYEAYQAVKKNPELGKASLSDAMNKVSPWLQQTLLPEATDKTPFYRPVKGGLFDPTVESYGNQVTGALSNPATYFGGELVNNPISNKIGDLTRTVLKKVPLVGSPASKAVPWIARSIVNPGSSGLGEPGENIYKSGDLGVLDLRLQQAGEPPLTPTLMKNRISGSNREIAEKASNKVNELVPKSAKIITDIDKAKIPMDYSEALSPAEEKIKSLRMRNTPASNEAADIAEKELELYRDRLPTQEQTQVIPEQRTKSTILDTSGNPIETVVPAQTTTVPAKPGPTWQNVQNLKTDIYNNAYKDVGTKTKEYVQGVQRQLGRGHKELLEKGANQLPTTGAPLGETLANTNRDIGTLMNAAGYLDKNALKGEAKNLITSIDPLVYEFGASRAANQAQHSGLTGLALKKLADLQKTTAFKTGIGLGLYDVGNAPGANAILRNPNIWRDIYFNNKQENQ